MLASKRIQPRRPPLVVGRSAPFLISSSKNRATQSARSGPFSRSVELSSANPTLQARRKPSLYFHLASLLVSTPPASERSNTQARFQTISTLRCDSRGRTQVSDSLTHLPRSEQRGLPGTTRDILQAPTTRRRKRVDS